jgi:hypothetical protein
MHTQGDYDTECPVLGTGHSCLLPCLATCAASWSREWS